jgi:hypothetical protein
MGGCGVGFSVERQYVASGILPQARSTVPYTVEDTAAGGPGARLEAGAVVYGRDAKFDLSLRRGQKARRF